MMRRWLTSIVLSAVILVAVVMAIAGCGSQKRTIPTKEGQSFLKQLDNIGSQVDNGACSGAEDKVNSLENQISGLPSSVDPEVKRNLVDGVQRLAVLVRKDCQRPTRPTPPPTPFPPCPPRPPPPSPPRPHRPCPLSPRQRCPAHPTPPPFRRPPPLAAVAA